MMPPKSGAGKRRFPPRVSSSERSGRTARRTRRRLHNGAGQHLERSWHPIPEVGRETPAPGEEHVRPKCTCPVRSATRRPRDEQQERSLSRHNGPDGQIQRAARPIRQNTGSATRARVSGLVSFGHIHRLHPARERQHDQHRDGAPTNTGRSRPASDVNRRRHTAKPAADCPLDGWLTPLAPHDGDKAGETAMQSELQPHRPDTPHCACSLRR